MHGYDHKYLKGLFGLRAIACLWVLFDHIQQELEIILPNLNFNSIHNGPQGVTIFFVLSGFLITKNLLDTKSKSKIDVIKFYKKRILRIFPLYYFYLLIIILVVLFLYPLSSNYKVLPFYFFLTPNVPWLLNDKFPLIGHYWSLGIEEQFYLVWPIIVSKKNQNLLLFSIIIFTVLISIKFFFVLSQRTAFTHSFLYVFGYPHLMLGCIGAILFVDKEELILKYFSSKLIQIAAWLVYPLLLVYDIKSGINSHLVAFATLIIIFGQISQKHKIFNLEVGPLIYIGKISYGIYIYHPLVLFFSSKFFIQQVNNYGPHTMIIFYTFTAFCSTMIISGISFKYFERYFLQLKKQV